MNSKLTPQQIGKELAGYFAAERLNQAEVAKKYEIAQSWVARIYAGRFTHRSSAARRMCGDADIPFDQLKSPTHEFDATTLKLTQLLAEVWEGTREDADLLIEALQLIRKLKQTNLCLKRSGGYKDN